MKTINRTKTKKYVRKLVVINNRKLFKTSSVLNLVSKRNKKRGEKMNSLYNKMTSGQRSAQALITLKKGFSELRISKNDPFINNLLERTKTYEK